MCVRDRLPSDVVMFVFKQKTAYEMRISDWSSDVCSSDLLRGGRPTAALRQPGPASSAPHRGEPGVRRGRPDRAGGLGRLRDAGTDGPGALRLAHRRVLHDRPDQPPLRDRSEERRAGKGWVSKSRSRWWAKN